MIGTVDATQLVALAQDVLERMKALGLKLSIAEASTGGLATHAITEVPGASQVLVGAVVPYDNRIKVELLGVPEDLLARHGAVSAEVALAMAEAVATRLGSHVGLAITGILGPGGGTAEKPVGLSYAAAWRRESARVRRDLFAGTRWEIKAASVAAGFELLLKELG
jgi:PncC family amidohydrolase